MRLERADQRGLGRAMAECLAAEHPGDAGAEKKFKELNEANEVLSNKENRKKYDQYGKDWKHAEEIEKQRQQQKQEISLTEIRDAPAASNHSFPPARCIFGNSSGALLC